MARILKTAWWLSVLLAFLLITVRAFTYLASAVGLPYLIGAAVGIVFYLLAIWWAIRNLKNVDADDDGENDVDTPDHIDQMVKGVIDYTSTHPDYTECLERHRQAVDEEASTAWAWENRDTSIDNSAIELAYLRAKFHRQKVEAEKLELWKSLIKQYMDSRS